jgi:hypothetical protein
VSAYECVGGDRDRIVLTSRPTLRRSLLASLRDATVTTGVVVDVVC